MYNEGLWHAIIGLAPQYDHMKGTPFYDDYMRGYNDKPLPKTNSEKDFEDGQIVICNEPVSKRTFTGRVNYSYGDEKPGFIRVQEIFLETSDDGNTYYVPVECIQ